ncbi:MAG: BA14K family protein [Bosea sp.]|uniref:BA14K family protein n=1 Tax=Bosea sp. (in: a-proteobacteria) TaxID=1871050 RepID=UPI001AC24728|nr:BA14K family protein [Bosea sp. (in: a-proteobacteria)]MBN9471819.1 BA14K family protein [Bosea sp. (in: a-proteobacteria)]
MFRTTMIAAAAAGAFVLAAPANAAPLAPATAAVTAAADAGLVETVQYRRYYGPRYGYRGGYYGGYRYNRGAAVGAGIAAGAIGALAAGALLAPGPVYAEPVPPPYRGPAYATPDADAIAYCSRRFRTYDPETGTYIGTGGVVRACP